MIVGVGLLLRVAMVAGLPHPLETFTDANVYVRAAHAQLFLPLEGRTAGYPLFLRVVHGVWGRPEVPVVLQHLIALLACAALYVTGRRIGLGSMLAAVPAALWALPVDWLWLEHQLLTETLSAALGVAAVALAFTVPATSARRAAALGLACALVTVGAGVVRPTLLLTAPGLLLGLVLVAPRPSSRRRIAAAAAATYALGVGALGVTYVALQEHATGFRGLIGPSLDMGAYVGMAPIADCARFDVPPGTESLCERTPPARREGTDYYYFAPRAPGRVLVTAHPELLSAVDLWGRRAAAAQRGDLRRERLKAFRRLLGLGGAARPGYDYGPREMRLGGADRRSAPVTASAIAGYYGQRAARVPQPRRAYRILAALQPWTRPPRQLLLLALLVTALGGVLGRGLQRRAAIALGVVAWLPLAYATYTGGQFYTSVPSGAFLWRYALPSLPVVGLAAMAAVGALMQRRHRPAARLAPPGGGH